MSERDDTAILNEESVLCRAIIMMRQATQPMAAVPAVPAVPTLRLRGEGPAATPITV